MSTKKEKCCEVCESPNGCITAFIGQNCPCHQSESIEWEQELRLLLEKQGIDTTEEGGHQILQEQKDLFSKAITTAVAKREKEIAEELEKLETDSYPAVFGDSDVVEKSKVLQILKH